MRPGPDGYKGSESSAFRPLVLTQRPLDRLTPSALELLQAGSARPVSADGPNTRHSRQHPDVLGRCAEGVYIGSNEPAAGSPRNR